MLDKQELKPILEALIFAADSALGVDRIATILEGEERAAIKEALEELVAEYAEAGRGFTIEEVAGGYQYRTNPDYAPWLRRLFKVGLQRISKAAMEALAIVAYKQPATRAEVEAIRGVDSGGVLATLMDKRFIKIVGRKELPGRPVVYGTTKEFLETFDLKDLSCLPSLKDIQKMEEEDGAQDALPEEKDTNGTATEEFAGAENRADEGAEAHSPQGGEGTSGEGTGTESPDSEDDEDFEEFLDKAVQELSGKNRSALEKDGEDGEDGDPVYEELEELPDEAVQELDEEDDSDSPDIIEELEDEERDTLEEDAPDGEGADDLDEEDGLHLPDNSEELGEEPCEEDSDGSTEDGAKDAGSETGAEADKAGEDRDEEDGREDETRGSAEAPEDNGDGGDSVPEKG